MPGKRARRYFSQLSEFERGLIIRMKTAGWSTRHVAARWIVRSVPIVIVGSSGHEKVPTRGKPCLERPGRPQGERIEGSCGKTCGPHSDSFNDTSRRKEELFHKQFPDTLQKQILNTSALSVHSL
ncbi:hypothetical protein TNCV_2231441 [Trichonephila clavipes]|nr:hypothetical protein TNCV_2231441 [Trichonephila clavipes]